MNLLTNAKFFHHSMKQIIKKNFFSIRVILVRIILRSEAINWIFIKESKISAGYTIVMNISAKLEIESAKTWSTPKKNIFNFVIKCQVFDFVLLTPLPQLFLSSVVFSFSSLRVLSLPFFSSLSLVPPLFLPRSLSLSHFAHCLALWWPANCAILKDLISCFENNV